jgi:hypothetical protein
MLVLVVTALIKLSTDNVNGEQLQTTRDQLVDIDREIDATLESRDQFDDHWSDTVRPWREQLEIATRNVEILHGETGDRTRRGRKPATTGSTSETHIKINPRSRLDARRVSEARGRYRDAMARWRNTLTELGLPTKLSPSQARLTIEQKVIEAQAAASLPGSALEFQLRQLRNDLDRRRHSLAEMMGQSRQLVQELGYSLNGTTSGEQMEILRETIQEHREDEQNRQELTSTLRDLCSREQRLQRYECQLNRERRECVEALEKKSEAERAKQQLRGERTRLLQRERDQIVVQIDELIVRDGEDATATALAELTAEQLDSRLRDLQNQQITFQAEIVNLVDGRARCHERLQHVDEIQKLTDRETAWADVLANTRDLSKRWQEASQQQKEQTHRLAAQMRMAESYAYLQLAAENSSALANFAVDLSFDDKGTLRARGKDGKWSALRRLRQHRLAQLYISLWLACIQQYADRGVKLPVILDDVLSITPRDATNLARLLRDFAARGHQLLLITSSQKHADVFAGLDVPIADLADRQTVAREEPAESVNH